ncbi:amino acid adenylation domain-containing protein [Lentzea sp. NPDC003310]|uniref:amino acid adenylation domain-containing protein n=1 Tax=Lentzea sp. NPDC003310 TaxID=3154447 RepID=UPI0033B9C0CE
MERVVDTSTSRAARIAALPAHVQEELRRRLAGETPLPRTPDDIPRVPRDRPAPLSPAQQRLWYLHEVDPGSVEYTSMRVLRLHGELDLTALRRALTELVARHEPLRTRFSTVDGQGVQLVGPATEVELLVEDCRPGPGRKREEALGDLLDAEARVPFDLRAAAPFRVRLVRMSAQDHVLVLTLHHILTDGWSMGVIADELTSGYAGRVVAPPVVQYADFAAWQRDRTFAADEEYWAAQLAGLRPVDLPTDRPRPPVRTSAGDACRFAIGPDTTARLGELAAGERATLFMVLAAAVQLLVARYSGSGDVAVGTARSGRNRVETERLVGFFVNTVVLRSRIAEDRTFTELLGEVRSTVLDAFAHDELPFQRLLDLLKVDRDPSRSPLTEVVVNLQNAPVGAVELPGLRLEEVTPPLLTASTDLAFDFFPDGEGLAGFLTFNSDLYDAATARRITRHLGTLLTAIAAAPRTPIGALSIMDDDERALLVEEWPVSGAAVDPVTAGDLFAARVAETPHAPALEYGDTTLTYAELDEKVNRLARFLMMHGAGPEKVVAVALPRSASQVVAVLAVLRSGAAYLPLDPAHPKERLEYVLADARPVLAIAGGGMGKVLQGVRLISFGSPEVIATLGLLSAAPVRNDELRPGHPAYVIYTSGSTGRPKGVVVTHAGLHGLVRRQAERFAVRRDAKVLQFASPSFDAAISELGMALFTGATLVVADAGDLMPGEPLAELVARHRITHVTLPPTALRVLDPAALPTVTTLVVAGEACPPALVPVWSAGRRMINAYGPTEATVCAAMSEPLSGGAVVPIGRPLAGTAVRVLDAALRPVPAGVPGELYLSGQALARGYLGRHALTAERFVADPYGAPGTRMYRTGDRARWSAAGELEFLGRTDDQVKIRGYRIEPGEVENVLTGHDEVAEAAVVVRPDTQGSPRLVAYVVSELDVTALRDHVRRQVPEHMVPALFVSLESLPLNQNGKVDRAALPDPVVRQDGELVAAVTPAEQTLARIWADLLGVAEAGVRDNFFELGGDSILGLQVVARARDAGWTITPKQTFLHQTIAELAAVAVPVVAGRAEAGRVTGEVTALPIQHWFSTELAASADRFNQSVLVELPDELDQRAWLAALAAVFDRHDMLRARVTGGAGLEIPPDADPRALAEAAHRVVDLSTVEDAETAIAAEVERAQRDFPLATGPLVRSRLFPACADRASRLYLAIHHLVVDGVSWRVLLGDLDAAYRQALAGTPVELGARTTSFAEYSSGLAGLVRSGAFDEELEHWRAATSSVRLPLDHDGTNTVADAATVLVRLGEEETEALLRDVPKAYRTQVNDVLLSALGTALVEWTGGGVAEIALEGHGREEVLPGIDLSGTVGWFTTLYPVSLTLPASGDWGAVLKSVKEQLRAVPRNGIGYGALRYLGDGLDAGRAPEVSFNYLGRMDAGGPDSGLFGTRLPVPGAERAPEQVRPQLVEINSVVAGGRLDLHFTYGSRIHDERTIRALAERFAEALREIVRHCAEPSSRGFTPSDFPLAGLDQSTVDLIATGDIEDVYPLSPAQAGMLFHSLASTGRDMYTGHFGLRVGGVSDVDEMAAAWQRVVDRTPVLRTSVRWQDVAEPVQVVHARAAVPVEQVDLRALTPAARDAELARRWDEIRSGEVGLGSAPLLRLHVVRLTDDAVQLFWSVHHMMVDGWSFAGVLSDVFTEYAIGTGRVTPDARVRRRPYRDHLAWLADQDPEEAERYWRRVMAGFAVPTALPYDRPPVRAHGSRTTRDTRLSLSAADSRALYDTARNARITVNTLVQGAWAVLLGRYAGERDVCFGATVAGRPGDLPGVESIIGPFINTVPVRVRLDGRAEVVDWLRDLQHAQVESRQFEHVALNRIQRCSDVPGGTDLFDSLVVFENYPYDSEAAARFGLSTGTYLGEEHTNYALTLTAHAERELHLSIGYDPALFDEATAERIAGHLVTVLRAVADNPAVAVDDLPLLTDEETTRLLVEWNDTDADFPEPELIHSRFGAAAARYPDLPAVTDRDTELTYAELDRRSGQLANLLAGKGIRRGDLVGVCTGRTVHAVVALLAVLKAGAAFVPLDPSYPRERLDVMIDDAELGVVVTDRDRGHAGEINLAETDLSGYPETVPHNESTVDDLAYVIYTSGTTGRPKGVMVEHRHLHHMIESWDRRYGIRELAPVVLSVSSLSVDLFVSDFVLACLYGGRMVICADDQVDDPAALADLMLASEAQLMITVPSLARAVVAEFGWRGTRPEALRVLMVGSEGWHVDSAVEVSAGLHPDTAIVNCYGSTETTVDSTTFQLGTDPLGESAFVPVGTPMANTRIYVLDDRRRPVPVGIAGECHIGGGGVSRGYLNRPELTAERFLDDPFVPGGRMYRTGDLVRRRADGNIEYLGRTDDQVKVRGFRVELGEVETALGRHPGVERAAAAVRPDAAGVARLVGYLVPATGGAPGAAELRAFLASSLPAAAVPTAFVVLDELPHTPSGTVDRRALPSPDTEADPGKPYVAPGTAAETEIAEIWREVLGVRRVGVLDDFFDLGGDSVLGIRVVSRVRARLGVAPSPRLLFDAPTAGAFAAAVAALDTAVAPVPITPADRSRPLPLSHTQRRLWFLHDFAPDSAEYNTVLALRLTGALDVEALHRAVTGLVRRNESLRTVFDTDDGVAFQMPRAEVEVPFTVVDLSAARERLDEVVRQAVSAPFDLRTGPLLRALVVRLREDEHVLSLVMHHIATDGWSMGLLTTQLAEFYVAAARGEEPDAEPRGLQYADYAAWQQRELGGAELGRRLGVWRERLAGRRPLDLATDHPRPAVRSSAGAMVRLDLPAEVLAGLREVARACDATLFMALVAGVQLVLSRRAGQDDVTVGTATSGRDRAEVEDMTGFFVNTVPLRSTVDEFGSFAEHLGRVRATVLEAFAAEVPFELLVDAVSAERDPSRTPVVEAMVVLQNASGGPAVVPGLEVEELTFVADEVGHDLMFDFIERDGRLLGGLGYSTALFEQSTAEGLLAELAVVFEHAVAEPARSLRTVPTLPERVEDLVLREWTATAPVVTGATLTGLLAPQSTSDSTALCWGTEEMSHRELHRRAVALATHLVALGAGPDTVVGVCAERGPGLVTGLLATLYAGAAYLPLDPAYPAERLGYMVEDSGAVLVLATGAEAERFGGRTVVPLDEEHARLELDLPDVHPDTLAYVIYTSGSTGTPKGVMMTHRGIAHRIAWAARHYGFGPGDRVLQKTSASFDASVWEFFQPLAAGGVLVLAPPGADRDPAQLAEIVEREQVTTVQFVPTMLRAFVEEEHTGSSLRHVFVGGEPLPADLRDRALDVLEVPLHNEYGPTEAAIGVTHAETERGAERVLLGPPLPGTRLYVLDERLRPVAPGVPGELHIAGVQLARGYRGRLALTAERFVASPFGEPGERMYRTGDLVRWTPDGRLEHLGRTDDQLKFRGFRVEPGEIEAVLREHAEVSRAVVVVHDDRLVAHVQPAVDGRSLRAHLSERLPAHLVPSVFVPMTEVPLTPNGKVDRRALPAPAPEVVAGDADRVAPSTDLERALAGLWAGVLRVDVDAIGLRDNFFALGGDSLLGIQLASRARRAGLRFSSRDLFLHQTIAELAPVVSLPEQESTPVPTGPGEVPLTPIQHEFFATHPLRPEHFTQSTLLRLRPGADPGRLRSALVAVTRRHDALALRFERTSRGWSQVFRPDSARLRWVEHDLAAVPENEVRAVVHEHAVRAEESFDLAGGPLFTALYFEREEPLLFLTAHHLVVDAVSWQVLLEELSLAYDGQELAPPSGSYREWATRLRDHVLAGGLDAEREHWAAVPAPVPLPVDDAVPPLAGAAEVISTELSAEETERLTRKVTGRLRSGADAIVLSAVASALARWTGDEQVVVDLERHGREDLFADVDLSGAVGWFTSKFPVALTVVAGQDHAALVRHVRGRLRAVPGNGLGHGALRYLAPDGPTGHRAQVVFNYHGQVDGRSGADTGSLVAGVADPVGLDQAPDEELAQPLEVVGAIQSGRLRLYWHYAATTHRRDTVQAVADHAVRVLRDLVEGV